MSKYCSNCGNPVSEGAKFCDNCGQPIVQKSLEVSVNNPARSNASDLTNSYSGAYSIAPGFSERINDPEILAAVKKNKKAAGVFGMFIVPIPFIGFTIYSIVSDKMELKQGMLYGAIVSAVFLLFALYSKIKSRSANAYEAVVVDKKQRERSNNNSESESFYTEYITVVKTTDGKKKKIVETDKGMVAAYNYLQIGERFKYHPQFAFPYELYDKSKAPYIACVSCGTHNTPKNDRCCKCNVPLLK